MGSGGRGKSGFDGCSIMGRGTATNLPSFGNLPGHA
jgi:hypothetical protein